MSKTHPVPPVMTAGTRVTRRPTRELDELSLHDSSLLLAEFDDGFQQTTHDQPVAVLRIRVPGKQVEDLPLLRGALTLGRSKRADVELAHRSVSRRHLGLEIEPARVIATDLGSAAGTFVDGVRLSAPVALALGASLALGEVRLELRPVGAPQVEIDAPVARHTQPGLIAARAPASVPAPPPRPSSWRIGELQQEDREQAARASALAELDPDERDALLAVAQRLELDPGHVLLTPGQPIDFLYVVVSGALQVSEDGRSVGTVSAGQAVELAQLLQDAPCGFEVRADEPVALVWFEAATFRAALARGPGSAGLIERPLAWPGAARLRQLLRDYGMDRDCAVQLINAMSLRVVPAGTTLGREGDHPALLQIVNRGTVAASKLIDAVAMPLSELREGTLFGGAEISLEKPYGLSYTAATVVEVLEIGRKVVLAALHRAPELATLLEAFAPARQIAAPAEDPPEEMIDEADDDAEAPEVSTFKTKGGAKRLYRPRPVLVRQHDLMDCGAACLAMVSAAYGRRISLAHFRAKVHVTREGASMWSLVRVARQTGFEVVGVNCSAEALQNLQLPAIALQQYHYVVIYEVTKTRVVLADPGGGMRRLPLAEFKKEFSGMVLLMRPTREFGAQPHSRPGWRKYFALQSGHLRPALEIMLAAFLQFGFGLVTPLLTQVIFDLVLVHGDTRLLTLVIIAMSVVALLSGVTLTVRGYLTTYLANRFDTVFSALVYRHVMRLPLNFFMVRRVGDLLTRFREIQYIRSFLTGDALSAVIQVTSIAIYLAILFLFSTTLGGLALGLTPVVLITSIACSRRLRRLLQESFPSEARAQGLLVEQLRALETVKALGAEIAGRWRWEEAFRTGLRSRLRIDKLRVLINVVSVGTQQLALVTMTYAAARMAIAGELSIGTVIAVGMFADQTFAPLQQLATQWTNLQRVASGFARIDDVLTTSSEPSPDTSAARSQGRLQGDIELRKVWFQYGSDLSPWAVKDVSITIKRGETVAFVGRSGSGKTTLVQLLNLLYRPTRGQILIGGKDITEIGLGQLRESIGMVMQDTNLFAGTVFDNITFGQDNATFELVMAAARVANAHGFISLMKDGYFTKLKEGGGGLSGGQRQRISLARALFRRPTILALDEATSALDSESEHAIVEAMKVFCRGRTSIIIAHRLSTVLHADRIFLLDKGRVVETGSHRELIARGGDYVKLFGAQLSL